MGLFLWVKEMAQESRLVIAVDTRQAKPSVEDLAKAMAVLDAAGVRVTKTNADVMKSVDKVSMSADAAALSIKRGLVAAFGGLSAMAVIDTADQWGQYASRIKMATNSTEEYEYAQKRMNQSAKTTFRAINETRESFIQMSPVLRDMGLSLGQSIDAVETFSGLLVVNGANAQRGAAAMEALAKSLQRGRVDAQAWMTIYSTTDTVVELLAKSMGKSADEVRRLGIEGKLLAEDMAKALVRGNQAVTAAVKEMPTTVRDAMQNLNTEFTEFIGWQNEAKGATAALASGIEFLGDNLKIVLSAGLLVASRAMSGYILKGAAVTKGMLVAHATSVNLAKANLAEAATTARKSSADVIAAQIKLNSVKGTAQETAALSALRLAKLADVQATQAQTAAQTSLNRAQSLARGAMSGVLGLLGGPAGLAVTAGIAATAWLIFSKNTDEAKESLIDIGDPLDETVKKFQALDAASRQLAINEVLKKQTEAADEADDAWKRLYSSTIRGVNQFGSAWSHEQWRDFRMELQRLHDAGESLEPALRKAAEAGVVDKSKIDRWYELASILAKANKSGEEYGSMLSLLIKEDEELKTAALGAAGGLDSLNAAMGIEKWDEYLKKLTDVRDVIGLNARQLAEFQAAQAGANTVQKAMAGIVGAQADEYKKLQSAIEEKDKKAIEAAQNNIRALDIERQKVELLAIKTSALIAATNAFATGEVSGDVASGILQSILGGFDQAEAAIAVSKEAEAQIKNIFANTTSSTKGGAKAVNDYAAAMKSLLDTHLPENKALEDLKKNLSLLSDARKAGKVSVEDYDRALKSINETYANSLESTKKQIEMERILGDLREQRSVSQIQFMRELESFGQGDRVRELNADLAKVEDRYRSLVEARRNSAQGLSDSDLAAIKASQEKELAMVREFHDKKLAIQGDWKLGALDTLRNYADEAANVYDSIGNAMGNVFTGMEDALTQFVTKGKMDFKSLADSIIQDMVRIMIQQSVMGPLASMFGGLFDGGAGTGNLTGGSLSGAKWFGTPAVGGNGLSGLAKLWSGGYTGDGGKYDPAGIVHKGEGVLNADEIRAIGGEAGFNALRQSIRGIGHSIGGMASKPVAPPQLMASRQQPQQPSVSVQIVNNSSQPVTASQPKITQDALKGVVIEIMLEDDRRNGPYARQRQLRGG